MRHISISSKKGQAYIAMYNRATATSLYECYAKPSMAKERADIGCKAQMRNEGGKGYKIIGYNCMKFTAAWKVGDALRVETADNSFIIF